MSTCWMEIKIDAVNKWTWQGFQWCHHSAQRLSTLLPVVLSGSSFQPLYLRWSIVRKRLNMLDHQPIMARISSKLDWVAGSRPVRLGTLAWISSMLEPSSFRFFTCNCSDLCNVKLDSEAMLCASWYFRVSCSSSATIDFGLVPATAWWNIPQVAMSKLPLKLS